MTGLLEQNIPRTILDVTSFKQNVSCIAKSVVSSFFCSHRSEFNNICFHYRKFQEILFSFQQVRSTVGLIQGETLIPDHPYTISTSSCVIELGSCQETNQQVTNFITNKQWSIIYLCDGPVGQRYYLYHEPFWFAAISEDIDLP